MRDHSRTTEGSQDERVLPNPEHVRLAAKLFLKPGQVTELRALQVPEGNRGFKATHSGYFDDPAKLAAYAESLSNRGATGVYFVPNSINPDLLARAHNRAGQVAELLDAATHRLDYLTRDRQIRPLKGPTGAFARSHEDVVKAAKLLQLSPPTEEEFREVTRSSYAAKDRRFDDGNH